MKKITVSILTTLLMLSMVFSSSVFAAEKEQSAWDSFLGLFSAKTAATSDVGVEYRGHIQNVGNYPLDGSWIQGPTELGTEGQGLRLEGFWIQLDGDVPADAHIEYQVHVQNVGWMDPVQDGEFAGTEGRSLQIEAIKISLVDDEGVQLEDYSVVYSGHVQNVGDVGPFTNGEQLGTVGSFLRLEAIEVEIVQNPADLTEYNAALAAVTQADYTAASWTTYQAVVNANKMTEDNLQSEVDAATANITAAQANLVLIPKVIDVTAINATQVTVTFNKEMDKTDAQTVARYTINGTSPATSVLSTDAKSVTLTFAAANQVEVTEGVVVVNPVKTAADTTISTAKYTKVLTFVDTVKPTLVSATAATNGTTATSLVVKVSEPIQASSAKIDGTYYTINFAGTDTATITGLSLSAATAHTLDLINLTDKATTPNVTVLASTTFNVTTDTVAPTATLSAQSDKTILVTFSKSMDPATVTAGLPAGTTAVKDETFTGVTTTVATVVANTDNKQFTIAVTSPLYTTKTSRTLTVVLPSTIKDSLGNAMVTTTPQIVLTKDTVKPAATGYKVLTDAAGKVTGLEVNFSEKLAASGAVTVPTIVNSNGQLVTATFLGGTTGSAVTLNDTKVTYTFTTPAKVSGVYSFSFPAALVSDQAETPNTSAAFDYAIDFGTSGGTFNVTSATGNGASQVTVVYPVAVKGGAVANSATALTSYTLAGQALPSGTTITLDGTQTTATITLPTNGIATTDANAIFTVSGVKSLTGDTVNSFTGTVSVKDNTQPILVSAVATSNKQIVLTYNEAMKAYAAVNAGTDFTVTQDGTTFTLGLADAQVSSVSGYPKQLAFDIVKTTGAVSEVLPGTVTTDGGLTIGFGAGTGDTLNGATFILGTITDGTPTTATYNAGTNQFTINGDFDNTTTPGMATTVGIQAALRVAAGAPAGAAYITVTGPVVEFTGVPVASSAVAGGITAVSGTAVTLDLTKTITITPSANAVVQDVALNGQAISTTPITVSK